MSLSSYLFLIKVMQKESNSRYCLANNIRIHRERMNLSREELSLMLGVDNSYISKLEKGRINITLDRLEQLAKILKTDAHKLLVQ